MSRPQTPLATHGIFGSTDPVATLGNSLLSQIHNAADPEIISEMLRKTQIEDETKRLLAAYNKKDYADDRLQNSISAALRAVLRTGDVELLCCVKDFMQPEAFKNQLVEVFKNALPPETRANLEKSNAMLANYYEAVEKMQQEAAAALCMIVSRQDFTEANVEQFKSQLERYVKESDIFNPYILLQLYQKVQAYLTSTTPPIENRKDYYAKLHTFFTNAIGFAQALLPTRWLHFLAYGIDRVSREKTISCPRSLEFRHPNGQIYNIRTSYVDTKAFGTTQFMSVYAVPMIQAETMGVDSWKLFEAIVSDYTAALRQALSTPAPAQNHGMFRATVVDVKNSSVGKDRPIFPRDPHP